jgi:hypothetical protein
VTWQTKAWRTPSARQERIEHENQGMSEWCFQCGVAQRPQRAVGWDEDGEPACSGHAKRAANPLKLDRPAEVQVAETPVSVHSYPGQFVNEEEKEEAAAPSPVQTSAVEAVMPDRICSGYRKQCTNVLRPGGTTSLCGACYARRNYHEGKEERAQKRGVSKPMSRRPDLGEIVGIQVPTGSGSSETSFGPNRFTAGQLDKLWALLSPASKAEAIDHLLGTKE